MKSRNFRPPRLLGTSASCRRFNSPIPKARAGVTDRPKEPTAVALVTKGCQAFPSILGQSRVQYNCRIHPGQQPVGRPLIEAPRVRRDSLNSATVSWTVASSSANGTTLSTRTPGKRSGSVNAHSARHHVAGTTEPIDAGKRTGQNASTTPTRPSGTPIQPESSNRRVG